MAYLSRGHGARAVRNTEYLIRARRRRPPVIEVYARRSGPRGPRLSGPEQVIQYVQGLHELDREAFVALLLDTRHRVIGVEEVARGHLGGVEVHPRELFKSAILANAAGLILAHNHPSGDPDPSPEDHRLTERMEATGEILGIPVLDHVVVGEREGYSMRKHSTHATATAPPAPTSNPGPWFWVALGAGALALLFLSRKRVSQFLAAGKVKLLSRFGAVRKPTSMIPKWRRHTGTDLAMPAGTPIRVLLDGVVARSDISITDKARGRGYGEIVVVRHQRGNEKFRTVYAHLAKRLVRAGDKVKAGEVIAHSGRSGIVDRKVPDHLHLELALGWEKPISPPSKGGADRADPLRFMAERGIPLAPGMSASSEWYGEVASMSDERVQPKA